LDEVSVYSLLSSRLGAVASEFTATEAASLTSEVGGSVGAEALLKAETSSRIEVSQSQSSQVLRKATVQSTFKELYDLEEKMLAIRPMSSTVEVPKIGTVSDLRADVAGLDGWVIDVSRLARGDLLEIEVELEAEAIFRVTSIVTALIEIMKESPELVPAAEYGQITQVLRMLDKLLVGLVPVRGRAVDYQVVEQGGRPVVIHSALVSQLQENEKSSVWPLYVVGVTEQRLYWKDLRRVLFSQSRYRVLARLTRPEVQNSWTPVKLADVLNSVAPDLAQQINALTRDAVDFMAHTDAGAPTSDDSRERGAMRRALDYYSLQLTQGRELDLRAEDLAKISSLVEEHSSSYRDLEERRAAFGALTRLLEDRLALTSSADEVADLRAAALAHAGFDAEGNLPQVSPIREGKVIESAQEWFLDTEIVAIYW